MLFHLLIVLQFAALQGVTQHVEDEAAQHPTKFFFVHTSLGFANHGLSAQGSTGLGWSRFWIGARLSGTAEIPEEYWTDLGALAGIQFRGRNGEIRAGIGVGRMKAPHSDGPSTTEFLGGALAFQSQVSLSNQLHKSLRHLLVVFTSHSGSKNVVALTAGLGLTLWGREQ